MIIYGDNTMTQNVLELMSQTLLQQALNESLIGEDKMPKLSQLVVSYLKRKTGKPIEAMPFLDQWKNKNGRGWGFRIVFGSKSESVRFNWETISKVSTSGSLVSIDYWTGMEPKQNPEPAKTVILDKNMSMVKVLPMVAEIMNDPSILNNESILLPLVKLTENEDADLAEIEADFSVYGIAESVGISTAFDRLVDEITDFVDRNSKAGKQAKKGDFYSKGKSSGNKLFDMIAEYAPDKIEKAGVSLVFTGNGDDLKAVIESNRQAFASSFGGGVVKRGGSGSEYINNDNGLTSMVEEAERIAFEQQLSDLEDLVALVVSGATNALFAAGRGGVGKTFNVEKALNEMGLQDGSGYYKVTGDISEPGLYTYLWEHRNDIILFDDADGVFKSQVSRNMIKAATDTKAKRKLFWLKKSSFIELEDENSDFWKSAAAAEGDDGKGGDVSGKAPQSFTFTGRILFISNLPRDVLDPDGALRTRGVLIDINPTEEEVWDFIEKIMDSIELPNNLRLDHAGRVEVVTELKQIQKAGDPANIRKAVRGFAVRASAPTKWKNLIKYC